MNKGLLGKILPHFLAILIFLVVSALVNKPALEGNSLVQYDTNGWKGMAQNAFDCKEKNGHFPLWNPNAFSGMPNYQIAMEGKSVLIDMHTVFGLGMPVPVNFFFIACVCFYILCMSLKLRPLV